MNFDKWEHFWYKHPFLCDCIKLMVVGAIISAVVIYGVTVSGCGQTAPKVEAPELTFEGDAPETLTVTNTPKTSSKQTQNNVWPWMILAIVQPIIFLAAMYFDKRFIGWGRT